MTAVAPATLAKHIQFTLIGNDITAEQITAHCRTCLEYGFHAAMVPGIWVPLAKKLLAGSSVRVASFIDFPLGTTTTAGRVAECRALVEAGAQEVDVMMHLGYFKSGMFSEFSQDLKAVAEAIRPAESKIMLELPLLNPDERERVVELAIAAGFDWLKNASGGAVGVATPDDIRFLKARAPQGVRVKASGGIKTAEQARALLAAGAELLGTSAGVAIVTGGTGGAPDSY
jgi:deoxyribose-phosphate aldolase